MTPTVQDHRSGRVRRGACTLLAALTAAGAAALTAAPAAHAQPFSQIPGLGQAPGSSAFVDEIGRPTPMVQQNVRGFAEQPWVPQDLRNVLLSALEFTSTSTPGEGVPLPDNAPVITQFYWPTVSGDCIGGELDAVGSALAVPGPAQIPAPGASEGQTAFLFTALGTSAAAAEQGSMIVHWVNLNTFATGRTSLENHGINPQGPATVSGVADTGKGTILAVVAGDVRTQDATCSFIPTAAKIDAR